MILLSLQGKHQQEMKAVHLSGHAQGTTWSITYFATNDVVKQQNIDSIFERIDSSLSLYRPYSAIVKFNNENRGIRMDRHLQLVVDSSVSAARQTKGLFDITVAPLVNLWGFGRKKSSSIPKNADIKKALACVSTNNLIRKGDSLIKRKPCVKIDVNGIAQGYTVDVIADFLESRQIENYIVEVGGELRVKGLKQPSGERFKVGIESPSVDDFSMPPMQKIVSITNGAVTTSGNYRKYHESKGKRYSHIIDPRTGRSVNNEMISVTVFAPDAITADAYDNALMLMHVDQALRFVEKRPHLACFIIYRTGDGSVADTASSRFAALGLNFAKKKPI